MSQKVTMIMAAERSIHVAKLCVEDLDKLDPRDFTPEQLRQRAYLISLMRQVNDTSQRLADSILEQSRRRSETVHELVSRVEVRRA